MLQLQQLRLSVQPLQQLQVQQCVRPAQVQVMVELAL
jgi:hypothetical protein